MLGDSDSGRDFTHAGAGTSQVIVLLSVMIPGLLPSLALLGVVTVVLLIPVIAGGLAATVLIAPPLGLWRLVTLGRRRRNRVVSERRGGAEPGSWPEPLGRTATVPIDLTTRSR